MATIAENQPNRPRRAIQTFPDSPITIPTARAEAARNLLTSVYELWEEGQHYRSLQAWFATSLEERDDVINSVLLQEAEPANQSLRDIQYHVKGRPESLVLDHYALLTSAAVGKIINPSGTTVTLGDAYELSFNPGEQRGNNCFAARLRSIGLGGYTHYYHDADDFTEPRNDITRNFDLEEEREFLLNLIPHIGTTDDLVEEQLLRGVVHAIRHADLLTDRRLADHVEKVVLLDHFWLAHLENFLAQGVFPSAAFFEEAFRRLKPEESAVNAVFRASIRDEEDTPIPASVYYFSILRKITSPENNQQQTIVSYLLSDAFMEHALPYLETGNVYPDDFIAEGDKLIFYHARVEATGDEGRRIKRERFGEILVLAEKYLTETRNAETIKELKNKEVAGVRFVDYWPTEANQQEGQI